MKYLLVEDKVQHEQVILDSIAEFLWNNGHEIYTMNNVSNRTDYLNIVKSCDCIILLTFRDCRVESIFGSEQGAFQTNNDLGKSFNKKIVLVFSTNGVYCNALPFPHKLFHFKELCQNELVRFFHWCRKLSLFTN